MLLVVAGIGTAVLLRGRSSVTIGPPPAASSRALQDLLDPAGLALGSASESKSRVDLVFPKGIATEDARTEIGTAPAPPEDDAPDGHESWVAEIALPKPSMAEDVRGALPRGDASMADHWIKGRVVGSAHWLHVADADRATSFDRVAVIVDLVRRLPDAKALSNADVERELAWARAFATSLGAAAPAPSLSAAQAISKGEAVLALRRRFTDDQLDASVAIVAPAGKRFRGRLAWDVVYSAGFRWGDGDYFHWVASPNTDVSQGISMGTSTGSGYFLPESVAADDKKGDVEDLEMSFNIARTWTPSKVFDVMAHTATYAARRLGGAVVPSDLREKRENVATIEAAMRAAGIVPGSSLALHVF